MPSKEVVLDIETQSAAINDLSSMRISVIGCYFYETNTLEAFEEHELPTLWNRLEQADRLIGYNSKGFDLPIMNNYYTGDFLDFHNLDLLEEIHKALGFRLKLDDVAAATVGQRKSGHGLQAVEWWKQGEVQKIKDYCLQDVNVTKQVYEYGLKYGALAYEDRFGGRKPIQVDFQMKQISPASINLTMRF
jgi:DEAD/DEAH box helicase domain-containing protein